MTSPPGYPVTPILDASSERTIVYTSYPRLDPSDYAINEGERQILSNSGKSADYVYGKRENDFVLVPSSVVHRELCNLIVWEVLLCW